MKIRDNIKELPERGMLREIGKKDFDIEYNFLKGTQFQL